MSGSTPLPILVALQPYLGQVAAICFCLLVLAFCSLSEAALIRVEPARARQLAEERRRGARRLERLIELRQEALNSLVLLINLCVIVASAFTTEITIHLSGEHWVPATSLAMIFVLLVLCEVTPKTYAVRRPELVGLWVAPLLSVVHAAMRPLARGLNVFAAWLLRHVVVPIVGGSAVAERPLYSDEEVMDLVSASEAGGEIEEEEREMIDGVIEFADNVAREVMTPRTDMVCIPDDATLVEAAKIERGNRLLPAADLREGPRPHHRRGLCERHGLRARERRRQPDGARDRARSPRP